MMEWEAVAAVAAIASAVASVAVFFVAAHGLRLARLEFELAKRPLVILDDWVTRTRSDASGRLRVAVYATIRETIGIPTIVHRVVSRTIGGFPSPGLTEPREGIYQVVEEPVLVYGDQLMERRLFLGWVFVRDIPPEGRRLWVAMGQVAYTFSAEGGIPQDWSVSFRIIYHSTPQGELPCFVVVPFTSGRPRCLKSSKLRDLWERWKQWNLRIRDMR